MRTSVERLRIGLLVGAGLLVLVIAAFLGYARYKIHKALVDLPGRMGATVSKEFNGYTYSQSDGKRTVFTIHAAKAVQHKDGTYTLHDVNMILYGKKGDRADRISGDEFEYDTKNEVIRAAGIVHLDLEAPAPGDPNGEARKHLAPAAQIEHDNSGTTSRVIHVKTSGLIYMKKRSLASTDQGIEFAFGGFTGHAIGAQYSSDTGHVVLQSAITVSGVDKGRPVAMTSTHGEMDRSTNVAEFANARYSSAGEFAQAELCRLHMRTDGTVERIEGERHVQLGDAGQGTVASDRADVSLDDTSKPTHAILTGSVRFVDDEPLRQARGESDRATLGFDTQGHLNHAVMQGRVQTVERVRGTDGQKQPWSERTLTADNLEAVLVPASNGEKPQLRDVRAAGSARMTTTATVYKIATSKACGAQTPVAGKCSVTTTTKLAADSLQAHLISTNGKAQLSTVHGTGKTFVDQGSSSGVEQSSSGDTLDAAFRESAKGNGAVELVTAVQQGGVVINRTSPGKPSTKDAAKEVQHAIASKATFNGDTDLLTLTGDVELSETGSVLRAASVVFEQDSGDANADGGVKVTYQQQASAEPIHVLASRAAFNHDAATATFYGRPTSPARLWQSGASGQGGSQVEAPVLVFEQEQKRLTARAETPGVLGQVHVALAEAPSSKPSVVPAKDADKKNRQGVARIVSSQMVYSDLQRTAEFTGGVHLLDGDGEMRAQQATVLLAPGSAGRDKAAKAATPATPGASVSGLLGGSVQRIVATQHILITQPGRRATGDRLVYTAEDQMFVLTGTAATPPKVVDAQQGTTTGAALRFHTGDDSVVISGRDGDAPAQKVHTETQVKQQQ